MTIGEAIKSIREEKGITQGQVEKKIDMKREYISKIENNHIDNPTFKTLCRIAKVLQVKLSDIIRMVDTVDIPVMKLGGGNV